MFDFSRVIVVVDLPLLGVAVEGSHFSHHLFNQNCNSMLSHGILFFSVN